MRLGKPMEHLQAALRAALTSAPPLESITTIGRQLGYFLYLFFDMLAWVISSVSMAFEKAAHIVLGPIHQVCELSTRYRCENLSVRQPLMAGWNSSEHRSCCDQGTTPGSVFTQHLLDKPFRLRD